ncbi:MAG: LacI family DNA-binding transcriptional regulator [Sphaerochaetaceae bacterium]|nr:LacI family DNA-binding transcriptional regulator [Sphaerochaetaceae bacterium]
MASATILDVAKLAGVSPSTVTHALNGKRPVSSDTKQKVNEAISSLGYVASRSASNLRSGKSGIIGCYAVDITESFANQIVRGIEKGLAGSGKSLLFASGAELDCNLDAAYDFFRAYDVDGLLFCHHLTVDSRLVGSFSRHDIPVVSINKEMENIPSIVPDNYAGGRQAADHLISSGMRYPAIISGPLDRDSAVQRNRGFMARLDELGIAMPSSFCLDGAYSFEHGYEAAKQLLEKSARIDGLFCSNDYIAAGAITAATESGRKVPDDVLILGFDNRDFSSFWPIPISTFEQPLQQMGFMGIGLLRSMIDLPRTEGNECSKLQSNLIVRASTTRKRS